MIGSTLRCTLGCALVLATITGVRADDGGKPAAIEPRVASILRRCVACHQGDEPSGGLDLTHRASALQGGESGAAIVPGKPADSPAYRKVSAGKMPPKEPLSAAEVETLRGWIAGGAAWVGDIEPDAGTVAPNWAMKRLARPEVPRPDAGRPFANPIDAFLAQRLKAGGLTPRGAAEKRILARRIWFDLVGLPPSPEELGDFLADDSASAYEKLVDRLLASPHHGEKWARHWLDVARFGESEGFEYDRLREAAWPYRDYVIRAFNADKPYAEFVRDQLAGDVRPGASSDTIAATGFLVAGPFDEANNAQSSLLMKARTREEELEDTIAAVSQSFLGLTVNCARCHDHKFDPIKQDDYYRLASVFAGVRHGERVAMGVEDTRRREAEIAALRRSIEQADREIMAAERPARSRLKSRVGLEVEAGPSPRLRWSFGSGPDADAGGIRGRLEGGAKVVDGVLRLNGKTAYLVAGPLPTDLHEKTLEVWARVSDPSQRGGSALTIQARRGGQFDAIVYGEREPRKWMAGSDGFVRSKNLDAPADPPVLSRLVHVAICYDRDGTIRVYRDGLPYGGADRPAKSARVYPGESSEILIGLRHTGAGNGFFAGEVDEARVYDRALASEEVATSFRLGTAGVDLATLLTEMAQSERASRDEAIAERERAATALASLPPVGKVYAANPSEPGLTNVLLRGDVEKRGKPISAGGLSFIRKPNPDLGLAPDAPEADRRRKFADWVVDRDNPLTARVMANRLWHYHFGTGLVATPNDFGASGERPSHPELLDWLACELRDNGGSLKRLHRLIVTSEAYKRSSQFDAASAAKDAESRLLWRFPPRRLEGEVARDAMLAASGRLNRAMYGPSFRPFTITVFNSNIYTETDPTGPEFERRTIYRMHVLSAKSTLLESLDCPDPATKIPRRGTTTTPLQALAMMNDTFVLRQAKGLADRARLDVGEDPARQVDRLYMLTLSRSPTADETARDLSLAKTHGLKEVAWMLLNASEFIYVE